MTKTLFTVLILFFFQAAYGQNNTFLIDTRHWTTKEEQGDSTGMMVNGKPVLWDTALQVFITHYPGFDTLNYQGTDYISRFHQSESYKVVGSCCSSIDLLPSERAEKLLKELDQASPTDRAFDSILSLHYDDRIPVRFSRKHVKKHKNQCAYFPEQMSFPLLIYLEKVPDKTWFFAPKGGYRTNFCSLVFIRITDSVKTALAKYDIDEREDIVDEAYIENAVFDAAINYRFFHDEKIELEYDPRTKSIKIKIIE